MNDLQQVVGDFVPFEQHAKARLASAMLPEALIIIGPKVHLHFVTQDVVLAQEVCRAFADKYPGARVSVEFKPTAVGQYVICTGTGARYGG